MRTALLLAILLTFAATVSAQAEPRGAAVYSSFKDGQSWYKDEQASIFREAGWGLDAYENARIANLIATLDRYAVVVFGSGYNYEHSQDLASYAAKWRAYLDHGGCLIVTDANYDTQNDWLRAIDPGLRWVCRNEMNPSREGPPAWVNAEHPLMRGVKPPNVPWTQPSSWSQALTPLVADSGRRPIASYLEVGQGLVVVSSAYRQYGFPNAEFLHNLVAWAKDPQRLAALEKRREAERVAANSRPEMTVPLLAQAPVVDGTLGVDEWRGAATIPQFVAMDGSAALTQRTVCRVGRTSQSLVVAFECYDSDVANVVRKVVDRDEPAWTDDCIEVFLAPAGEAKEYLHFVVSASGAQYDERGADGAWDRYWVARASLAPGMWTAEIEIPFASLDITADSPAAAAWAANFYREYQGRGPLQQELSGWSPTFSNFGTRSRFGTLRGIEVPSQQYNLASELTVKTPERWFGGANPTPVTVAALKGHPATVQLTCVDLGSQAVTHAAPRMTVSAGKRTEVPTSVTLTTDTPHVFQFVARDPSEPARVLASSRAIRAMAAPVLEMQMLAPAYRASIQSQDRDKSLRLAGRVGDAGGGDGALQLRASLIPKGLLRPIWQQSQAVKPRSAVSFQTSLANTPPGEYEVQIDLQDATSKLLARDRRELRVLPPAPVEVTFNAKRACYVNGKPVFPIGLYHVSEPALALVSARGKELGLPQISLEQLLTSCRDHGFNTVVRGWGMPGEEYMKVAQKLGLWVLPEIGAPDAATLSGMVGFANRYSNLLMWYGIDEPGGDRLQLALDAHDRFAKADPHRPVSAACNNTGVFADGVRAYDLLMMDPYFIRNASLEGIASWVDAGLKAGGGRVPVWVVPQAFALDGPWAEPTCEELRCQAYLSIAHGATGLVWYAWFTTETWSHNAKGRNQWLIEDTPLWPYFTKLNAEINQLAPVVLEGDAKGPAQADSEGIHSGVWVADGVTYVIAVNPRAQAQKARFSGLPGKTAEVLFEGRSVALEQGALSDAFAPLAVHIYRCR